MFLKNLHGQLSPLLATYAHFLGRFEPARVKPY